MKIDVTVTDDRGKKRIMSTTIGQGARPETIHSAFAELARTVMLPEHGIVDLTGDAAGILSTPPKVNVIA
jgi:hypothetical protein